MLSLKTSLVAGAVIGLAAASVSYLNLLGNLERSALDLRFHLRGTVEPAGEILIVGITESCLEKLGRWPWDRHLHAGLLDVLTRGEASVIGMDIIFAEPSAQDWMDDALVEATDNAAPVVYPIDAPPAASPVEGVFTAKRVTLPLPGLMKSGEAGFINVTPDRDGILRRAIILMEYRGEPLPSFGLLTWATWNNISPGALNRDLKRSLETNNKELLLGEHLYPLDRGGRTLINFSGAPNNFPVLPYHMVLEEAYPPITYRDKIILVGYYASGLGDYYFTPFSRDLPMYGVELHANIIHMLIEAGPIYNLPLWINLLMVFMMALLPMLICRRLHPFPSFAVLLVLAGAFFFITMNLFTARSLYIETVYPLVALVSGYVGSLGYSYIVEHRERSRVTRLFGRYVAPQVVNEILKVGEGQLKLGGTRRDVTLLFIDIRGFTPLSEKLSPEEVVAILNQYFDIVTRCVFDNNGTIDKFMGDAAMAIFNAPLPLEDHPLWALRAAGEIVKEGVILQDRIREASGVTLSFGIGINTGEAVVGNIGSVSRMEYTAIGDVVNLAARLEANAKPGQVLVSEAVYRAVDGRIPLEPVGEITVKGKSRPVMVYQMPVT